jgi:tetratricopeptide (TPR) repeat protein
VLCLNVIVALAPAIRAAQQAPAPPDLPAPYHGTPIDKALKAREWPLAEQLLVAAIERQPDSPGLLTVLGSVFLIEKKPLNAAIAIKKAEALAPLDDRTRFTLVLAYIALNHGDWARPELEKLVASDPSNSAYDYWLGRLDYDGGQYMSAVKRFQKVIDVEPDSVRAYDNLGLCYEALNRPDDAEAPYRKAVELNRTAQTKSAWPPLNLGILLRNRGELKQAEPLLREAANYEVHLAQPWYQLGVLLEQDNRPDDAIAQLKRATERDATYAEPYYALARIYRKQNRKAEADEALATFERLHDAKRATPSQ